jgi:hypothetical protein
MTNITEDALSQNETWLMNENEFAKEGGASERSAWSKLTRAVCVVII